VEVILRGEVCNGICACIHTHTLHIWIFLCVITHCVKSLKTPALQMGASSITPNGSAKNLGVIFDQCINMHEHITSVCRASYYHLKNIRCLKGAPLWCSGSMLDHRSLPPCSNSGVGISEGCFVFHFVSLPLEVTQPI